MGEGATVFAGDRRDLAALRSERSHQLTPNNKWPADHAWLDYTDYRSTGYSDLWMSASVADSGLPGTGLICWAARRFRWSSTEP